MELAVIAPTAACTRCDLHKSAKSVCIPTTRHLTEGATTAIYVISEHPGIEEDSQNRHLVGEAGNIFHKVMRQWVTNNVEMPLDWHVVNAVRCKPPLKATVTKGQFKACQPFIEHDMGFTLASYERVIVLTLGGGCNAMGYGTVSEALRHQSRPAPLSFGHPVFSTYNPAILLARNDPAKIDAIQDHLMMLVDYINTGRLVYTLDLDAIPVLESPSTIGESVDPLVPISIDIETYGAVDDMPEQTVFNAQKSILVDGVPANELLVTAAATWAQADGSVVGATWRFPHDKYEFAWFLRDIQKRGLDILGMNTQFDVQYIRAAGLPDGLRRTRGTLLYDLAVANFQYSDVRPERSLKQIAPLLRITDYHDEVNLKKGERYKRTDPRLLRYNLKDAAATLEAFLKLRRLIGVRYGATSDKLTRAMDRRWSDTIWTAIEMSEPGVKYDTDKLAAIEKDCLASMADAAAEALELLGGPIEGKGSQAIVREAVAEAARGAGLVGDRRLARSEKTNIISTNKENLHLLLGALPIGHPARRPLELIETFRGAQKLVGSYTNPMLTDPANGLVGGFAFPTWYIVPTYENDGHGAEGGTQQARLACKKPALPTAPAVIKGTMTSRFPGGYVLGADLAQIELRVAALLSGDAGMVGEYRKESPDLHKSTAIVVFTEMLAEDPEYDRKRQLGKTMNFLMLFRGGAKKLQATIRNQFGIEVPLDTCQTWIVNFWKGRAGLWAWQEERIQEAIKTGRLTLPITGDTRTFKGSSQTILDTYTPTICNFPIQDTAAWILKDAQRAIMDKITALGLRTVTLLNIYDAIYWDVPPDELAVMQDLIKGPMTGPDLYLELQSQVGRELPLAYSTSVYGPFGA